MTIVENMINTKETTFAIDEDLIMIQILVMKDSYMLWVGQVKPDQTKTEFNQLAVAMMNTQVITI
jgi:hypothetical protein